MVVRSPEGVAEIAFEDDHGEVLFREHQRAGHARQTGSNDDYWRFIDPRGVSAGAIACRGWSSVV
jgi:hypothetical protein